jgi:DNA-binding protein H-NS
MFEKLEKLLTQREELDKEIQAARAESLQEAIFTIQKLIVQFGITQQDLFPKQAKKPPEITPNVVYRNPTPEEESVAYNA